MIMNDYFVNLVRNDVKSTKDFRFVHYTKRDSYLIYCDEHTEPYMILFKDYAFHICRYDGCDIVTPTTFFDCLWDAIYYVREHNS